MHLANPINFLLSAIYSSHGEITTQPMLILLFLITLSGCSITSEGKSNPSDYICSVSASNGATSCDFSKNDVRISDKQESIAYDVIDRIDIETIGEGGISHNELVVALVCTIPPYQEVISTEFNRKPDEITSDGYGNRYAVFTGTDDVEMSYQVILHGLDRVPRIIVTRGQDLIQLREPYEGDHYFYAYEYTWSGEKWASLKVRQLWSVRKQSSDTWYDRGSNLARQGKYEEALRALDNATRLNPANATIWYSKGNVLNNLGKYNESIKACERAIEIDPKYIDAWNEKGNALNAIGRYGDAVVVFSKVIELNPKDADAWFSRGNILFSLGRYDEAIKDYDEAIALKPSFVRAMFSKNKALKCLSPKGV